MDLSDSDLSFDLATEATAFPEADTSRHTTNKRKRPGPDLSFDPLGDAALLSSATSAAGSGNGAGGLDSGAGPAGGGKKKKSGGFQSLGLSPEILNAVLKMGYKVPTPIQRKALPVALAGRDVVAMARTGSGKTAAFVIPLLERLKAHSTRIGVRAVVLSPTRELALQTLKFTKGLGRFTDLRFTALLGGESMDAQFRALADNPDVIIATPGRLVHMLKEVPGFGLKSVEYAVFDEADRLFEMGFAEQLRDILGRMPEQRQTLLFSATLPKLLVAFAKAGLREPQLIRLDVDTKISENLRLGFITVRKEEKPAALLWLLRRVLPEDQQAIVFVSTRHHSEFICQMLKASKIDAETIYGAMDQTARNANLAAFRGRRCRVLVVTDVAARGIDIPLLDNVINYDFPDKPKLFVHRTGRVARQGRPGLALSLVAAADVAYMLDMLLFLGRSATNVFDSAGAAPAAASGASGASSSSSSSSGYSLTTMRADDVHYGSIPRTALEPDIEAVRLLLAGSVDLRNVSRSADNALGLYNKTKAEASRQSIARARELPDDRVHPLLLQYAVANEMALRSFINGLSSFRPQQTIMELEGSKAAVSAAAKAFGRKRAFHGDKVAPRVGSVSLTAAAASATRGTADLSEFGTTVRERLLKGRGGSAAPDAPAAAALDDSAADGIVDEAELAALKAKLAAMYAGSTSDSATQLPQAQAAAVHKPRLSAAERKRMRSGSNSAGPSHAPAANLAGVHVTVEGEGGVRALSKSERKQLIKAAVAAGATAPAGSTLSAARTAGGTGPLTRAEAPSAVLFRDPRHYVSFTSTSEAVTEAGYSAGGTLGRAMGSGSGRFDPGRTETVAADLERDKAASADLAGLARFEEAALDLLPDEKDGIATHARRVRYWDSHKKKYLWVDPSEISSKTGQRRMPTVRNEAGVLVHRSFGGKEKEHKYGEVYKRWVKSTRQQVAAPGGAEDEDGGGGGLDGDDDGHAGGGRPAAGFKRGRSGGGGGATAGVVDFGGDDDDRPAAGGRGGGNKKARFHSSDDGEGAGSKHPPSHGSKKHHKPRHSDGRQGAPVTAELRSAGQIQKERLKKAKSQGKMRMFQSKHASEHGAKKPARKSGGASGFRSRGGKGGGFHSKR